MTQHFVTFESPGTFVHETTTKPIRSWDVKEAMKMARHVRERYNAKPFAFYFTTRSRSDHELDSTVKKWSCRYFLGGTVKTLRQIKAENDPRNDILILNMKCNGWRKVIVNNNSWQVVQPLTKGDKILEWP